MNRRRALLSQGYVVVGINHPYDVAAVALPDGEKVQDAPGEGGHGKALTPLQLLGGLGADLACARHEQGSL